jgi:hypothetical protein
LLQILHLKKQLPLLLFLLVLAGLSGYLMSKPSLIGRVGMDLFYKQYKFLKNWWQGALLVFVVWLILFIIEGIAQQKLSIQRNRMAQGCMILLALVGLYFTWSDFQHTTSHRWLKERFHIGAYLFWLGCILISISYLFQKKEEVIQP